MILNCIWWWGSSSGDLGRVGVTPLLSLLPHLNLPGVVVPVRALCPLKRSLKVIPVLDVTLNCIWGWGSGEYGVTPLLPLFPGPNWRGEVIPAQVPSIGQMDLFEIMLKMISNYICSSHIDISTKYEVLACLKWLNIHFHSIYNWRLYLFYWLWHDIAQQRLTCHETKNLILAL